jgi:N-methylhydantoinase A
MTAAGARPLLIGIDVGGTFTDVFVLDESTGRSAIAKVSSMRGREASGFVHGIDAGLVAAGRDDALEAVAAIVHGTTVGTNALLERKVARTGLLTTRGFRDVLEMRRRDRPTTWGLWGRFEPLVPRDLRIEIDERVLADGSVHTPVDPGQVEAAARQLLAAGCEAVCVVFLNAYANDANERTALARLRALWPNACVAASHEILPEIREFERASTTSLNASLQPVVGGYLGEIARRQQARGFAGPLLIVQSNGGVMTADDAARVPVRTALSGPAAGVIACARIAQAAGYPHAITGAEGGTSFDVSLIDQGRSSFAAQTAIEFGLVVRTPMIDIHTIGAGGGSIARVDAGGLLRVGPESAGSNPGPACYGRGNDRPTVTDANVVLGRIDAARPIGALATLDVDAARAAIESAVARPLGLAVEPAAEAILAVANARMAGAIRLVSIERGHDPKHFVYLPFGGAGALHVCAMMRAIGVVAGLVPRYPGITSALGCVIADMRHDEVRTVNRGLDQLEVAGFVRDARAGLDALQARLASAGIAFDRTERLVELDMHYVGQTHTIAVPLPAAAVDADSLSAPEIQAAFDRRYREIFGRLLEGIPVRVLNRRLSAIGVRPPLDLAMLAPAPGSTLADARLGRRPVFHGGAWRDTPVFARLALPAGATIDGPAILEQPDTTVWLEPGMRSEVDRLGNLLIRPA